MAEEKQNGFHPVVEQSSNMEHNVIIAFLTQALVIAAVFALGLCWFSFVKRYCERILPSWLERDPGDADDSNGDGVFATVSATAAAKKYPLDPPPTYNQADKYSQQELMPNDVLYPPPTYKELDVLHVINRPLNNSTSAEAEQELKDSAPSPIPRIAFASDVEAISAAPPTPPQIPVTRRSSAPVNTSDGGLQGHLPVGVHRHSIAVIADDSLPCGLVQSPAEVLRKTERLSSTSSAAGATSKWLDVIIQGLKSRREETMQHPAPHPRRRQTDHPYYPPNFDPREDDPNAFENLALEMRDDEDVFEAPSSASVPRLSISSGASATMEQVEPVQVIVHSSRGHEDDELEEIVIART